MEGRQDVMLKNAASLSNYFFESFYLSEWFDE
ncbi:hypothetical protein Fbal_2244 [Ferrimonas balearica DSM 9799]|uniref:Uncharacterized protein n=1 Tax=Ferrimonas balearica (strain DSM 9799 / CCM 4581 / KCTC 23876 / PAT) TaxID=550540 RepID=E1SWG5_FERBD|nr:hypothetical protein Fbal_2244 [Ferrimonas balearica DSM 9799]